MAEIQALAPKIGRTIAIDWAKLKAEYLKGIPPAVLAVKYRVKATTIYSRVRMEKWLAKRETVVAKLQEKQLDKLATSQVIPEAAVFVDRVKAQTNEALDVLESNPSESLVTTDKKTRILERVSKLGRQIHRLDEQDSHRTLHLHLHQMAEMPMEANTETQKLKRSSDPEPQDAVLVEPDEHTSSIEE